MRWRRLSFARRPIRRVQLLPLLSGKGRANHGRIMREAASLVDAGQVHGLLDQGRYTLDTVNQAHQALTAGTARGKVVVEIANPQ